ncbi:replicative DNA helicase [Plantactinospora solaniradicis]|uniref:Replicative DNA helicase n=2 Tax=Plantactinospora solaniradicis TaxID=1723736 RepID=A0ABW1K6L4_9ACTN
MADEDAERVLLGMLMSSSKAVDEATDILSGQDFYLPKHAVIWSTVVAMWADNQPTEPGAVRRVLEEAGELARAGGDLYLFRCVEDVPTAAGTASYYARVVRDWSKRRIVAESGMRIVQGSKNLQIPVDALVDSAQRDIHQAVVGMEQPNVSAVADLIDDELDHLQALVNGEVPRGISTGLGALDELIGGWQPGQLVIPAGRPGMGKSVAGLGFARSAARRGIPALVFSLEMSKRELMHRLISDVGEINLYRITSGTLDQHDITRARGARDRIAGWPLHIDDQARTVAQIRSTARRFRQKHGALGVIFVDYLQLLTSTTKSDRRDLEVAQFSKELKALAKELQTTVIAACQLNRKNEDRGDKRPQLSDLRDSGSLEQDADIVILLHRDDYYEKECPRAGEADFIVAKHRNGPTDTVQVGAPLHYSRFVDYGY